MEEWEGRRLAPAGGMGTAGSQIVESEELSEQQSTALSIQVVGAGTVGEATGRALGEWGHDVTFKDVSHEVRSRLEADGHEAVVPQVDLDVDLSLVAVPTPYDRERDTLSMEYIHTAVDLLARQDAGVIAIRSTVLPGTTNRLADAFDLDHYAAVPEFLFADQPLAGLRETNRILVGAGSDHARRTIRRAFGTKTTFVETTPTEAEFIKLASNGFGATKISFANEIWRLAGEYGESRPADPIDPETVLTGFRELTPWLGADMGLEGGRPYAGHCLPKDVRGLSEWSANEMDTETPQLDGTIAENVRMTEFHD